MKSATHGAFVLLLSLALSVSAYAESGADAVADSTPFAAGTEATVSIDAARQLAIGNAAYNRGDYAEAYRLYRNISILGVPAAQYRLAMMYLSGQGVRKSASQAEYWMRTAAKVRYPGAAEALALIRAMTAQG